MALKAYEITEKDLEALKKFSKSGAWKVLKKHLNAEINSVADIRVNMAIEDKSATVGEAMTGRRIAALILENTVQVIDSYGEEKSDKEKEDIKKADTFE